MVQKRPLDEEESNEVSAKQPRQLVFNILPASALEVPSEHVVQMSRASGEAGNYSAKLEPGCNEKPDVAYCEHQSGTRKYVAGGGLSSIPCCSLDASGCTSEEDIMSFHFLVSPDYYNSECSPKTNTDPGEIYSYLLNHAPRKSVPVGPDFQADIPEWGAQGSEKIFSCSKTIHEESAQADILHCDEKLVGTCILPMPDSKQSVDSENVGLGRMGCLCEDVGSIRCVQQHILEERDKLMRTLGPEAFAELGFYDMGEVVAEKWSEDEEQLFHEVIYSNPASLGNNFWNRLEAVFHSRTKKEIVSYYFNVFMLRIRAEQNRFDPMNIDSDNDEWQGTDYSAHDEAEIDEDDDSAVDPRVDSNVKQGLEKNADVHDMDNSQSNADDFASKNMHVLEKCDDTTTDLKVTNGKNENHRKWSHLNGTNSHEFMLEAYNAREWDTYHRFSPRNEVDLLPTCSMIEEVFGAGSWNYKARDELS